MSSLRAWLSQLPGSANVPLFELHEGSVRTFAKPSGKRLLRRSTEMERTVISLVKEGEQQPSWRGLLYVMAWGERDQLKPLYIGKAGRYGKTPGQLSANLKNITTDKSKFARWGDGNDYHIGDLSQTLFGWSSYKSGTQKYSRWAEMLFAQKESLRLREPTYFFVAPWHEGQLGLDGAHVSLEEAEEQAIAMASEEFEDVVLNVIGETWWATAASELARFPVPSRTLRPYEVVDTLDKLATTAAALLREESIGLDVETSLYSQQLCLVQIATLSRTYVIDPLALPTLELLRPILGSAGPIKVIHNASFEKRILGDAGFDVGNVFDTLRASRQLSSTKASHTLAAVSARHLNRALDKSMQTSNWASRPLSPAQLEYAAIDAEVVLDLREALRKAETTRSMF